MVVVRDGARPWGFYDPSDTSPGDALDFSPAGTRSFDGSEFAGSNIVIAGVNTATTALQTPISNIVTVP